jgi:hypothetical protein
MAQPFGRWSDGAGTRPESFAQEIQRRLTHHYRPRPASTFRTYPYCSSTRSGLSVPRMLPDVLPMGDCGVRGVSLNKSRSSQRAGRARFAGRRRSCRDLCRACCVSILAETPFTSSAFSDIALVACSTGLLGFMVGAFRSKAARSKNDQVA